jgi:hypothetical protein
LVVLLVEAKDHKVLQLLAGLAVEVQVGVLTLQEQVV